MSSPFLTLLPLTSPPSPPPPRSCTFQSSAGHSLLCFACLYVEGPACSALSTPQYLLKVLRVFHCMVVPLHARMVVPLHARMVVPLHARMVVPLHARMVIPLHGCMLVPLHGHMVVPLHARMAIPLHGRMVVPLPHSRLPVGQMSEDDVALISTKTIPAVCKCLGECASLVHAMPPQLFPPPPPPPPPPLLPFPLPSSFPSREHQVFFPQTEIPPHSREPHYSPPW